MLLPTGTSHTRRILFFGSNSHQPRTRPGSFSDRKNPRPEVQQWKVSHSSEQAGVESAADALSMSGYGERTQESFVYGKCGSSDNFQGSAVAGLSRRAAHVSATDTHLIEYATTRPRQEQSYAGLAQPPFDPRFPSTQPDESHALTSNPQVPYLGQTFEPRDASYQTSSTSLTSARSRSAPEVTSSGPFNGRAGEKVRIDFRSPTDYSTLQVTFTLMFQEASSKAQVSKNYFRDQNYFYTLTAGIPPFEDTKSASKTMPLLLDVEDESGQKLDFVSFGNFTYLDASPFQPFPPVPRKRKFTEEPQTFLPAKRAASQPVQTKYTTTAMYPGLQTPLSGPPQYFGSSTPLFALPQTYDRSTPHQRSYAQPLAQSPSFPYTTTPALQQPRVRSPSATAYGTYSAITQPSASPRLPTTPAISAP